MGWQDSRFASTFSSVRGSATTNGGPEVETSRIDEELNQWLRNAHAMEEQAEKMLEAQSSRIEGRDAVDREREEALHVGGPSADPGVAGSGQVEGVGAPIGLLRRDDVHVSGE